MKKKKFIPKKIIHIKKPIPKFSLSSSDSENSSVGSIKKYNDLNDEECNNSDKECNNLNEDNDEECDNLNEDNSDNDEECIDLFNPHINRETIEKIVGRKVNDLFYYRRAFVHKSIQGLIKQNVLNNEKIQKYMTESNEVLEFLGDSVFGSAITFYLFKKYPNKNEGFLTKIRTRIVKSTAMANFAEKIGIKGNILMSKFVIKAGGKENRRFLEDAFEALVGAIRLDLGIEEAEKFSINIVKKYVDEKELLKDDNYKDLLLRFSQYKKLEVPIYECIKEEGPPHKREFTIQVKICDKLYGTAKGKTKKIAEQKSAKQAINILGITEKIFNESR